MVDIIKVDSQVVAKTELKGPESHHIYNGNKKGNFSTPVATFGRDLKRLVPVGDPCFNGG